MGSKSKFQISRSLDERLKAIINCPEECEPQFYSLESVFILGFNYSNVTNYVGLTTNFRLHNGSTPVVGLAYLKISPNFSAIQADLKRAIDYFRSSTEGLGDYSKIDKNEHLYLIYFKSEETNQMEKKLYDSTSGSFLQEQPKLSVLDDAKIYGHSAIVRVGACIKLNILAGDQRLREKDELVRVLEATKEALSNDIKNLKVHLLKSNFSSSDPLENKSPFESLYSHLDIPDEVMQAADYLPQVSKEDRKKLGDKWRNKARDNRAPMEFHLELDGLSAGSDENVASNIYKMKVDEFMYLHANDSLAKCTKYFLLMLRQKLELLKTFLQSNASRHVCTDEIKACTFKPSQVNHFVQAVYLIPSQACAHDFDHLAECRRQIHLAYLLPLDKPAVRYSQRIINVKLTNSDQEAGFLCNVHTDLVGKSGIKGGTRSIIGGTYTYHHYLQTRVQDSGWGCAYRSLQTIISWFKHQGYIYSPDVALRVPSSSGAGDKSLELRKKLHSEARVPTHEEIQKVLVDVGDKQPNFVGTEKWIGSQEVCYVLNHLFNLESKFISVSSGAELVYKARDLGQHFSEQSTPVMIGGGVLAHTIIGLDFNEKNGDISYLVLDPHYTGGEDLATITKKGWCGWKKNAFWDKSAFYNLCLPQRPNEI